MSENILVVEYEPRYTERVRAALAGQPYNVRFAKDGEEAMQAIAAQPFKLIVLSSVTPKVSTTDLIAAIRNRADLKTAPILLTVPGYTGKTPRQDAVRLGASDILPKPFTESELLGKVQQLIAGIVDGQLTSSDIFADVLNDDAPPPPTAVKKPANVDKDNIDKMLADTLGSVMPKKREVTSPGTTAVPQRPRTQAGTAELDKLVQDTLSGLEKKKSTPPPAAPPKAAPAPAPRMATPLPDRIPVSYPVITAEPPSKEEEEPVDGVRFGQYVLLEKIATGGMAEVWKARKRGEEGFQKTVAIKKILPHLSDNQDFIEMFIDEAKLAAQLNHNNIIHIYDLGKIATSYYIAMEYVDGYDLKTILKRAEEFGQPLSMELALFVASKIAAALDYAHRKRDFDQKEMGLVHRDVSPQNVLISQEGDIKLCDFGIAKAASKASNTQTGALKGKLQYMAPEQAWGRNIDRRSDIFALGTVLYEMLAGRKLFTGDNEMSIIEQVREARVVPPSQTNDEVTPQVDAIVLKALQKDPAARYQTAAEMARDIDSVLYSFRPTPTSADLAIFMHRLWSAEASPAAVAPQPESAPLPQVASAPRVMSPPTIAAPIPPPTPMPVPEVAPAAATAAVPMPAWDAPPAPAVAAASRKRSPAVPLTFAALLIAGVVGAFLYVRSQPVADLPVQTAATVAPQPASTQPAVVTEAPAPVAAIPVNTTTAVPVPQQPLLDASAVAQEVERRLAAERARLEEQNRLAQQQEIQQQQTAAITPPRPVPVPQQPQPQVATQTTAPPPPAPVVTQTTAPAPVEPEPQQTTQEAPAAAAPVQYRQGDLVPPGTTGLVGARVIRRGNVPYPPMARQQRVEGTVILNVLVSETGDVLDVRVLRGVSRPVGLNEAAVQSARRTTFSPPTINGVRVKAWTTVPVDFKL